MHPTLPPCFCPLRLSGAAPRHRRDAPGQPRLPLQPGCQHCHVNAGPTRSEGDVARTVAAIVAFLAASPEVRTLDLTGGARTPTRAFPRPGGLRPGIARRQGHRPLQPHDPRRTRPARLGRLPRRTRRQGGPHRCPATGDNVDRQRGTGVFDASIRGLRAPERARLRPDGQQPGAQPSSQPAGCQPAAGAGGASKRDYRHHLGTQFSIVFDRLFTLANMPIQRFGSMLVSKGQFNAHTALLKACTRDANLRRVMCRGLLRRRLAGLSLRLRLQPAARPAAARRRPATPAHRRHRRRRHGQLAHPHRRPPLRLHRRTDSKGCGGRRRRISGRQPGVRHMRAGDRVNPGRVGSRTGPNPGAKHSRGRACSPRRATGSTPRQARPVRRGLSVSGLGPAKLRGDR